MTPPFADRPAHLRTRHGNPHKIRRWVFPAVAGIALSAAGIAGAAGVLDKDRLATLLGFGIEQVSLSGHRFTSDRDIFDALDLPNAASLASFDAAATGKRFEQLSWVKSAEITRIWPGQLRVHVTERTPFAIWEHDGTASLVDATGRVLGPVKADAALALPRIHGAGANTEAASLWSTLNRYPAIKDRLQHAERVGGRRWTLALTGGVDILLPADGEGTALARLAAEPQLAALINGPGRIVDLRAPGRIAHRAVAASTGQPAGAAP